jgi:hypothetical protein
MGTVVIQVLAAKVVDKQVALGGNVIFALGTARE